MEPKGDRFGKVFQDMSNFASSPNVTMASGQKQSSELFYSGQNFATKYSSSVTRATRVKNVWENVLPPSSMTSRWQTSPLMSANPSNTSGNHFGFKLGNNNYFILL